MIFFSNSQLNEIVKHYRNFDESIQREFFWFNSKNSISLNKNWLNNEIPCDGDFIRMNENKITIAMIDSNLKVKHLIFCFNQEQPPQKFKFLETFSKFKKVLGCGLVCFFLNLHNEVKMINERTAQKWLKRFKNGILVNKLL